MKKTIASYLGKPVSVMLGDMPFKLWPVEQSFENDLEEPIIHYVFPQNGLELRCDRYHKISTIFLYSNEFNGFDGSLFDIPFSLSCQQTRARLGPPSKSSGKISDPILGEYGPWDRFARLEYMIHVEYWTDANRIKKITLIRNDAVPAGTTTNSAH